jgi:hypothetical protein
MQKDEIKIGVDYALRETRKTGALLQRVRILQHVRGKKWKAKWIEPNPGLVDYVESQNLIVRWKDHKALLRDEEHERQLREYNIRQGYRPSSPLENVLGQICEAVGEPQINSDGGIFTGPPEALERFKERARVDQARTYPYSYVDRHGTIHIPFDGALAIAKAFCTAEPSTVLIPIETTERKWVHEASQPGGDYLITLLNEYRASWAIIRQWAGYDAAISQREGRIQQLERLVWDAIYALQKGKLDEEAHRLRRALERI